MDMAASTLSQAVKPRIIWMDLLRIFSIFAVIILHISAAGFNQPVKEYNFSVMNFYNSLSRFCVPVFVMISGAMFLDPKRQVTYKKLFLHNVLRIVTAFIFWSAVYALYGFFTSGKELNLVNFKGIIKTIIVGEYHMWFLFVIVGLYILTPILREIAKNKKATGYFLAISCFFVMVLPFVYLFVYVNKEIKDVFPKLMLDFLKGYPIYFLAGYYFKEYGPKRFMKWIIYALGIASTVLIYFYTAQKSIENGTPDQALYYYFSLPVGLQSLGVFTFFKEEIGRIRFNETLKKVIVKLSALSFGGYLAHALFLTLLSNAGITNIFINPAFAVPIKTLLTFGCAFLTAYIISFIPIVKKYII